jgi:2-amino-4-hydroxy-6-hydroxymethyldihydropteridine diphosphokinase
MILIAVGANLAGPEGASPWANCQAAVSAVAALPGLKLIAVSSWYRTAAIPADGAPDYCNGVIRLEGEVGAVELMQGCQAIERAFGREHGGKVNAPRPLDLDVIDLNGQIRAVPAPILPHPRAHLRAFVLRPIMDVAPSWRHPTLRLGVGTMLSELPGQAVQPWVER